MKKQVDLICPDGGTCSATTHIEVPANATDEEICIAMEELAHAKQLVPLAWEDSGGSADPETEEAYVQQTQIVDDDVDVDFVFFRNLEGKLVTNPPADF